MSPSRPVEPVSLVACAREAGAACPHCARAIRLGDAILVCQACGGVHHRACYQGAGGCGSYSCIPPRRDLAATLLPGQADAPPLTITDDDLARAAPWKAPAPPRAYQPAGRPPPPPDRGTSGRAIAALATAVAGLLLFGPVTGLIAVALGAWAIGTLRPGQKGTALAVAGILLGVFDVIAWTVALALFLNSGLGGGASAGGPALDQGFELPADLDSADVDPAIRRGLLANVVVERRAGLGTSTGSGVILAIDGGEAIVVTNRHVADPEFPGEADRGPDGAPKFGNLTVRLLGQPPRPARGLWAAPKGVDLALVAVRCESTEARAARWRPAALAPGAHALRIGDPVFAIGNPYRLGWTHTQGVVSQFRTLEVDGRRLRIIQTQAAINPGNSGGGLYDRAGRLVGINTFTSDKQVSEGLGFAIALSSLLDLAPQPLAAALGRPDDDDPPATAEPEAPQP